MIRRDNIPIVLSIAISVGLHLTVIPFVYSDSPSMAYVPPAKASHLETPREEQEIELGIDESQASTLTWIGYKEYEEQRARFAAVEQAAMNDDVELAKQPPSLEQLQRLIEPFREATKDLLEAMMQLEISMPPPLIVDSIPIKPNHSDSEGVTSRPTSDANLSDRDSDATSIVRISPEHWKAGKPAAGEGIVLRPRRPSFTANQLVTNAPSSLVAALYIDKRGKPIDVLVLMGTGSGSIDRSIESSLYKWRASGDRINALEGEETVRIEIHITFSR